MPFGRMSPSRSLIGLWLLLAVQSVPALELGESCVNPKGESGKCILFRDCAPLVAQYSKPNLTTEETQLVEQSKCGVMRYKVLVCCVDAGARESLPEAPRCGIQVSDRIFGGNLTQVDEFPWTALIQYDEGDGNFNFYCGGSLINERYVVTAAHCLIGINRRWKVHRVRLGEWDLQSEDDCCEDHCAKSRPIDLEIEKIVAHRNYDTRDQSKANDIALIRLSRSVAYSDTVRPICLPWTDALRGRSHVGYESYAAGWGKTETSTASERKLKVLLNVTTLEECSPAYRRSGVALKRTHLCAGGMKGKDTCRGDSGGPLMRQIGGSWYLIGVVSFGPQKCGTALVPGVYSNVAEYVDWIRDNIEAY
uniref:CLIP domain-containing serine protease n=1 Tax=Anopheles farauti TaxID=69004 RepID=A0A182QL12_9DIPT